MGLDDPDNPLAIELRQEIASAYFAACRQMVDALEALKVFDREVEPTSVSEPSRVARRSELLEHAAERVYFVLIQREAIQFSGGEKFFEDYDIPGEVRSRLGPRRIEERIS